MASTPLDPVAGERIDAWRDVEVSDTAGPAEIREIFDRAIGDQSLDHESLIPNGMAEWFVVAQTLIPALLYVPGAQTFRLPIRVASYTIALIGLAIWWFKRGGHRNISHPSERWLLLAVAYLATMMFHPQTDGLMAGAAQIMLYVAIFSAVFWAPAYVERPRQLVRILAIMLICNGINSIVGVLQVYDPDRWMPRELSFVYTGASRTAIDIATYIGPDGRRIVRPPGLFDTPGAVCGAGTVAALLGLVFALERFAWWKRLAALGFALAGISAIYLSHVRASLVVTIGMMAIYSATLASQGERKRLSAFAGLSVALVALGLMGAVFLGGTSVQDRFGTLLKDDPGTIYYSSRGQQLANGFSELVDEYPFGAGLARWGMMRTYFGDRIPRSVRGARARPSCRRRPRSGDGHGTVDQPGPARNGQTLRRDRPGGGGASRVRWPRADVRRACGRTLSRADHLR